MSHGVLRLPSLDLSGFHVVTWVASFQLGAAMPRIRKLIAAPLTLLLLASVVVPGAAQAERRIALVIGNASYEAGPLNTPANDAGMIAQTLQASGFDVVGARDLDQDTLRHAFRDFFGESDGLRPQYGGLYLSQRLWPQVEGENYFAPIDAGCARFRHRS
jgi:hypothetical protein